MAFDKNLAKKIQEDAILALEKVAKKHGVTIKSNGGTLAMNEFIMKLKVEVAGEVKKYADWIFDSYGLPNDIIGKTFVNKGLTHTISEISTKSPKFPVITKADNGKEYKFTVVSIKALLKIK